MNAFTRGALKCVCICWIAIAFGPAFAEDQPTAPNAAPSLASFLSANGTLELPLGFVGNIDPSGWSMAKSKDGPLRFVPGAGFSNQNKLFGVPGGCNGYVFSILVAPSGLIYLGGDFVICEEVLASHVAAYDPRTRRFFSLGTGAQNGVSGSSFASVYAMGLAGSDLYVAGDFNEAGGESANYVARWNGPHWSALGSGESNGVFGLG